MMTRPILVMFVAMSKIKFKAYMSGKKDTRLVVVIEASIATASLIKYKHVD